MSDPRQPLHRPADDGELLSAYLDGELDREAAEELEARLADDPGLAARLEETREVVEALAGLRAAPPPGYEERLRQRLQAERATPSLESVRAERARRRRWTPLAAVAGVLLVALVGGTAVLGAMGHLGGAGSESAQLAAGGDDQAPAADDADEQAELFAEEAEEERPLLEGETDGADDSMDAGEGIDDAEAEPAPAAGEPSLVDAGTVVDSEAEARAHLASSTAPSGVLGLALEPAAEVAPAFRVAIQRAEPFASGVRPDHCLDEVLAGARGPAVPVEVEALTFLDAEALAYVVVSAADGSDRLDRVEGWVVEPEGCATRMFSDVTPGR